MQKRIKEEKGITLVALVITIIILLILAGVALSLVIGKNGLIAKSKEGVDTYKEKAKEEQWQLEDLETGMEEIDSAELEDEEEHPELKQMKLVLNITEDNKTIQLPVNRYDTDCHYNCIVNWGDNTEDNVTNDNFKNMTHTYDNTGQYKVTINGICESLDVYWNSSAKKSLIKVEQWGATGLKKIDLSSCEKLTEIATPTKNSFSSVSSFINAFSGCNSLTSIPENLFKDCSNVTNFGNVFFGCNSLTSIPGNLFKNCSNVEFFFYVFSECNSLTSIPENLFKDCSNVTNFENAFSGCNSLTSIPENLFKDCSNVTDFENAFSGCNSLTSIPENLFKDCSNVTNFENVFSGCNSLTSIPENLFANCSNVTSFRCAFEQCTNLKGKSVQLWKEGRNGIDENSGGEGCYYKCEKLEDYKTIPEFWKREPIRGPQ